MIWRSLSFLLPNRTRSLSGGFVNRRSPVRRSRPDAGTGGRDYDEVPARNRDAADVSANRRLQESVTDRRSGAALAPAPGAFPVPAASPVPGDHDRLTLPRWNIWSDCLPSRPSSSGARQPRSRHEGPKADATNSSSDVPVGVHHSHPHHHAFVADSEGASSADHIPLSKILRCL